MNTKEINIKHVLSGFILLFWTISLQAQTYVTPTQLSGTAIAPGQYYNYTNIQLGPGTSVTVSAGQSVRLYIADLDCQPLTNISFSQNRNYIVTSVPRAKMSSFSTAGKTTCEVMQAVQYFDGLGRPLQTVQVKGSPGNRDIVQPVVYDQFGREAQKYLPYAATSANSNGSYKSSAIADQLSFYANPSGSTWNAPGVVTISAVNGAVPSLSVTNFEPSPLNRVLEQGAPGADWQPVANSLTGHTQKTAYATNNTTALTDSANTKLVALYTTTINANQTQILVRNGNYGAGQLFVTINKDENWKSGRGGTTEEYKDKAGRVVLKRSFNYVQGPPARLEILSTYYVYDALGNLAFVLPPGTNPDGTGVPPYAGTLGYQYRYDERNRIVEKKIPGKGWEWMVYNLLDQVIFSQDSLQRARQEVSYTKYDALGRIIITGVEGGHTETRASLQSYVTSTLNNTGSGITQWETRNAAGPSGYTNTAFPNGPSIVKLTINYYDDYDIPNLPAGYKVTTGVSTMTKGLLTASQTAVLNTPSDYLWDVQYYDDYGRNIRNYKQHYLGGTVNASNFDVILRTYNFNDQLTTTNRKHFTTATTGTPQLTINNKYLYDHMGRKLKTWEQLTNGAASPDPNTWTLVGLSDYNEIGQPWKKHLHATYTDSTHFKQDVTYGYNERGWLSTSSAPLFAEQLQYNTTVSQNGLSPSPQYNGNIAMQTWGTAATLNKTTRYTSDQLNRLTLGNSTTGNNENTITYDVMGNIKSLNRYAANTLIDQLTYTYTAGTNNLQSVADGTTNDNGQKSGTANYTYDGNGNLKTDNSKSITDISYNLLNLPQTITGKSTTYTYDATGQKLSRLISTAKTDYIEGIQYDGTSATSTISFIQTEEGRALPNGTTYNYEYSLTDHLGNSRVNFDTGTGTARLVQTDDYYPFGLDIASGTRLSPPNNYLYNNKELQENLGMYDYGARFYDPVIGRWERIDPKTELYYASSPYTYALNQPTNAIDPDGNLVIFINGNHFGGPGSEYWVTREKYALNTINGTMSAYSAWRDKSFAGAVMNQLNDHHKPRYYDGAVGGWHPFSDLTFFSRAGEAKIRDGFGHDQGAKDAADIIAHLSRDKNNNIVESIKIITHSMGGAYGKGFVRALKEYIKTLPPAIQKQIKITLVADFDPYQAGALTADPDIKTMQFRHTNGWNLLGMGWLANEDEKGLSGNDIQLNTGTSTDHSIFTFFNDISTLQEGNYTWNDKEKKWVLTP